MPDRAATTSALFACFDDFEALLTDLADGEWAVASLCPGWTVRDVATHLTGIETVLVGWRPERDDEPPPFHRLAAFMTDAEAMSNDALRYAARAALDARRAEVRALSTEEWEHRLMSPAGPRTMGGFMEVRIFDLWIHQRDMTVPLGRGTDDGGPAAEISLDTVHDALGFIVGKKAGLPDGKRIAFHLTGAIRRDMYVEVDGRARVVESLAAAPDVEITADSTAFMLLAAGRIDPQTEIEAERIGWTGDDEWGDRVARNLRFTI
jgi:uncharacterized protein (TIGR03083 family)